MPTYEYECERCGHRFDRFQSISEPPAAHCPECNGKVRLLISTGGGFIMKGSGPSPIKCGKDQTCCGRDRSCDHPPCEE
jgi:putative FmdB family regulatory protein